MALIGAVLLPAAIRAGLSPIAAAMAMNLFGHGFALSGDYVIQAAPKLTADAAGIPVSDVMQASIPLVLIMGLTTTITAFFLIMRDRKKRRPPLLGQLWFFGHKYVSAEKLRVILAVFIPLVFLADIICMIVYRLQGNDATALVGGTAIGILLIIHFIVYKERHLEKITEYFIGGFQFGFKVFGPVIPIAAFFYLGDAGFKIF